MAKYEKGEIVAVAFYITDPYGKETVDWRPAVYSKPSADGGHWVFEFPSSFTAMDGRWPECVAYEDIKPAALFWPWLENGYMSFPYQEGEEMNA